MLLPENNKIGKELAGGSFSWACKHLSFTELLTARQNLSSAWSACIKDEKKITHGERGGEKPPHSVNITEKNLAESEHEPLYPSILFRTVSGQNLAEQKHSSDICSLHLRWCAAFENRSSIEPVITCAFWWICLVSFLLLIFIIDNHKNCLVPLKPTWPVAIATSCGSEFHMRCVLCTWNLGVWEPRMLFAALTAVKAPFDFQRNILMLLKSKLRCFVASGNWG